MESVTASGTLIVSTSFQISLKLFFSAWLIDNRWHVGTRRYTACGKEAGYESSSETNSTKVAYWQFRPPMEF